MQLPEPILRTSIEQFQAQWPELASSLEVALSAIAARKALSSDSLAALEEAASSTRVALYEIASYLIGSASAYEPQATSLLLKLSCASKAHIRHNAVICLADVTPSSVVLDVLRRTLVDSNSRVRRKAADWSLRLRLAAINPLLEKAIAAETHPETLSVMEFSLALLRDGYQVVPLADGRFRIFYAKEHQFSGATVDKSVIEQKGLAAVVASLQRTGRAA